MNINIIYDLKAVYLLSPLAPLIAQYGRGSSSLQQFPDVNIESYTQRHGDDD